MNDLVVAEASSVAALVEQKRIIQDVMQRVMKDGEHYGTIPGCAKKVLYQSGAETLSSVFHLGISYEIKDLSTPNEFRYQATCNVTTPSGAFVGACSGEASTSETKYAWRKAACSAEFDESPETHRRKLYKNDGTTTCQVRTNPSDPPYRD